MPLSRQGADKCLQLLWDCKFQAQAPEQLQAYQHAISSLHAYLTDVLPATLPCVRAQAKHGVVEIFTHQDTRSQDIDLVLEEGEKLGIVLDSIDVTPGSASTASAIAVSLLRPNGAAAKDGRIARGDQVLYINGHSLSQVSLQRARWLLDSAERSQKILLTIIASGLMDGLRHAVSRYDMTSVGARASHHRRSRSRDSMDRKRIQRLLANKSQLSQKSFEEKPSLKKIAKASSGASLHGRPGFTPSIGSRQGSDYSLVSNTVETAAHVARSSMRSSKAGNVGLMKKRKVRKMHIMKGSSGLGLRIVGGKGSKYGDMGIFVNKLEEGGAAFNDGRLHPRDEILMVDGKSLVGLTHDEAVAVLTGTQKLVQLVVATEHCEGESMASSSQSIPEHLTHAIGALEYPVVAPEMFQSPERNVFQQIEMLNMAESVSPQPPDQMETAFNDSEDVKTLVITIQRPEGQALGVRIQEGSGGQRGIFVRDINPNGVVGKDKQLQKGDRLLRVNGVSLEMCTQKEALGVLTGQPGETITLEIERPPQVGKEVLLQKFPGQALGIQFTEVPSTLESSAMAVIIKKIALGSPADRNGQLSVGDKVVSVNGKSVVGLSAEQVKALLAGIPGGEIRLVMLNRTTASLDRWSDHRVDKSTSEKTRYTQLSHHSGETTPESEMEPVNEPSEKLLDCENEAPEIPESLPPALAAAEFEGASQSDEDSDDFALTSPGVVVHQTALKSTTLRPASILMDISGVFDSPTSLMLSTEAPLDEIQSSPSASPSPPTSMPPSTPPVFRAPPPPSTPPPSLPSPPHSPAVSSSDSDCPPGLVFKQFQLKKRPRAGLGITLKACEESSEGMFMVRRITAAGVAAKDGKLQVGDRLVSVNGTSLQNLPHAAVLQALSEAGKEVNLVVWRDPKFNLASSSMHSLGSFSNLSGSRSSLLSEDTNEGSPMARKQKHSIPASPLVARYSFSGLHSPHITDHAKRLSDGIVGYSPVLLHQSAAHEDQQHSTLVLDALPPHLPESLPPPEPETVLPPEPETVPPRPEPETVPPPPEPETVPPVLPKTQPPFQHLPEVSSVLPQLPSNIMPLDDTPHEPPLNAHSQSIQSAPHSESPEPPLSEPLAPPLELPETPTEPTDSTAEQSVDSRPPSLKVPRGMRLEDSPFEIELKKGLFGLGVGLTINQMGMLSISSLTSRSAITQDGNIRVGDILLSINDDSMIGLSVEKAEACLKGIPKGLFRLTVMPPPRDVTGKGRAADSKPPSPPQLPKEVLTPPNVQPKHNESDGIITETLQVTPGCSMGFEIEGGSDTPLVYILIKSLVPGSPAYTSGRFNAGDQLVTVGEACLIGMTYKEAKQVLDTVAATVEVVAQRNPGSQSSANKAGSDNNVQDNACANSTDDLKTQEISKTDDLKIQDSNVLGSTHDLKTQDDDRPGSIDDLKTQAADDLKTGILGASTDDLKALKTQLSGSVDILMSGSSTEDLKSSDHSAVKTRHTAPHGERHAQLCPEETMTVELTRGPGEKLGVGIVGGSDHATLKDIHVKQVKPDGVAGRDGRIKKGDRIISVNNESFSGLTYQQALQVLREAGNQVTLVTTRKIGRRASKTTTPLTSVRPSRHVSGESSRIESRRMSPQHGSPRITSHRMGSSDEGSRDGSRASSPQPSKRHRRRESVTAHGEVLTFREKGSTLPRKIKGAKLGVHLEELHKGPTGLGLQLAGSSDGSTPITVKEVLRGGTAYKNGHVRKGEEVIEVNGTSFEGMSLQDALKVMKTLPQGKISLILRGITRQ